MNPEKSYDFEAILADALSRVPNDVDKRPGSIIYDALAPTCYQLALAYIELAEVQRNVYPQTATGEFLELKAGEVGLERREATKAIKRGTAVNREGEPMDIPIGARFSTVEERPLIYQIIQRVSNGVFLLESEEAGTQGNRYVGELLPITNINNLGSAFLEDDLSTPGADEESDDQFRERFFRYVNEKAFGGNFIDYVSEVSNFPGVGGVQVYPTWNGGGTVKVVVIDTEHNPTTTAFNQQIKNWIDPEPHDGTGSGFAPIGHKVTVTTPSRRSINISLAVSIVGYTLEQVRPRIEEQLDQLFERYRRQWSSFSDDNRYYMTIFRSHIIAAVLEITGVANVTNVLLNNQPSDIEIVFTNNVSQLPYKGSVNVNEE